jgi:hypothetical protein
MTIQSYIVLDGAPRIAAGPATVHLTLKGRVEKKEKTKTHCVLFIPGGTVHGICTVATGGTVRKTCYYYNRGGTVLKTILLQPGGTIHRGPVTVLQSGGTVHGSVTFIRGTICLGSQSITLTRRPPRVAAGHCLYRVVQSRNPLLLKRAEQFTKPVTVTTRWCYSRRTVTVTTGWYYS